uniref:Uncharacterized protein n=1 Tax=Chenopodium quinoa TaxID=63459 RepID=A0A803NCM2_CHEQI
MEKQIEITQSLVTTQLYEAALQNDVVSLKALVELTYDLELLNSGDSDGNTVLHLAVVYKELQSPLHVAVKMGHLGFVKKILSVKPEMAEVVDQIKRSTPLHIAAAKKGWLPIVEMLLEVKPNMCFVHDQDGMTPLHVAAVNGNTDVLIEFLKKKHQAALERTTKDMNEISSNSHETTIINRQPRTAMKRHEENRRPERFQPTAVTFSRLRNLIAATQTAGIDFLTTGFQFGATRYAYIHRRSSP